MSKDEALKLALEALEAHADIGIKSDYVITAIKEALAQPEPQYVAFMDVPQRTWVGLTDEEVNKFVDDEDWYNFPHEFAKAVEAKLKEKNT